MKSLILPILSGTLLLGSISSAKTELLPLTSNVNMWESNSRNFADRFTWLDWDRGSEEGTKVYESKDLTFWGEDVAAVKISEQQGVMKSLTIEILNQGSSMLMNRSSFNKTASSWKSIIDKKLGTKGTVVAPMAIGKIKHTRVAWNCEGCIVVLSANQGAKPDRLELSFYEKEKGNAFVRLRGQQDAEYIAALKKQKLASNKSSSSNQGSDPSASKGEKEIRSMIREISARKAPNGISRKVQDAVNSLNVYRYLSGVPYNVKASTSMVKAAEDAAMICKKKGQLSHGFGHSTDKCNLAMNSGGLTMENSVMQYIDDSGDNNRARRGHRRWCLNHKMGKTGFGIDGAYSAMYSLDQSGRSIRKNYSYPGHGLYPIKYLHGNGWSYHIVSGNAPASVKVGVWKLRKKEDRLPTWSKEPDGVKLPCAYVNTYSDTIIFEPQSKAITKKGHYLVRLEGKGLKEQYLVKLF